MSLLEYQDNESDQSWSTLLNLKKKLKIGWNVALLSLNYKKNMHLCQILHCLGRMLLNNILKVPRDQRLQAEEGPQSPGRGSRTRELLAVAQEK